MTVTVTAELETVALPPLGPIIVVVLVILALAVVVRRRRR